MKRHAFRCSDSSILYSNVRLMLGRVGRTEESLRVLRGIHIAKGFNCSKTNAHLKRPPLFANQYRLKLSESFKKRDRQRFRNFGGGKLRGDRLPLNVELLVPISALSLRLLNVARSSFGTGLDTFNG